jgi:hypothetical protein
MVDAGMLALMIRCLIVLLLCLQVPGCPADLEAIGKPYCRVKRICPIHMKVSPAALQAEPYHASKWAARYHSRGTTVLRTLQQLPQMHRSKAKPLRVVRASMT